MEPDDPALFYTGLVAELYAALRSEDPDPEPYARFVARWGEPALELACGDGDPLLELRRRGLEVEGLDSSADMLARCRRRAAELGVGVVLHHATIEAMDLPRRYASVFLAGASFNLLPTDEAARRGLDRIRHHLVPGGAALVPLFVPEPPGDAELGRAREHATADGRIMRVTTVAVERDEAARTQTALLRYEVVGPSGTTSVERRWLLHWHTPSAFREMAAAAGLDVRSVRTPEGEPAGEDARSFVLVLTAPDG